MAARPRKSRPFNIVIIGQQGRLMYEALLFAASLRHSDPDFAGRLFVAEPRHEGKWKRDPTMRSDAVRTLLTDEFGAEILPFTARHFGQDYPPGNKIEALSELPENEPFIFFDTDTLITGELSKLALDFADPSASQRVSGTWPTPDLYGPGYAGIWKSLYDRFDLDFEASLDLTQPEEYWRRFLYFNAGWFYFECPRRFGARFQDYALAIKRDPGEALAAQTLDPWLDQIALPLVIHSFGGGRDRVPAGTLDGSHSCHYRTFPLLFAREPDAVIDTLRTVAAPNKIKKVLKEYEPIKRFVFQNRGDKVRALFDRDNLPLREQIIRNQIKKAGLWMR